MVGLPQSELDNMALGLSHSLSRYKLKFSPDKVDTMIIQAIGELLDYLLLYCRTASLFACMLIYIQTSGCFSPYTHGSTTG